VNPSVRASGSRRNRAPSTKGRRASGASIGAGESPDSPRHTPDGPAPRPIWLFFGGGAGASSRVRPRITLENVLDAERFWADRAKSPHAADLRSVIESTVGDAESQAIVREALETAKRDASAAGETVRAAQDRATRREADRARRIAAKGSR